MGIFNIFTAEYTLVERIYLYEDTGPPVEITDKEYIKRGESEGWLIYAGCTRNMHNEVMHDYKVISHRKPENTDGNC